MVECDRQHLSEWINEGGTRCVGPRQRVGGDDQVGSKQQQAQRVKEREVSACIHPSEKTPAAER
jgi:hypothetical protein